MGVVAPGEKNKIKDAFVGKNELWVKHVLIMGAGK